MASAAAPPPLPKGSAVPASAPAPDASAIWKIEKLELLKQLSSMAKTLDDEVNAKNAAETSMQKLKEERDRLRKSAEDHRKEVQRLQSDNKELRLQIDAIKSSAARQLVQEEAMQAAERIAALATKGAPDAAAPVGRDPPAPPRRRPSRSRTSRPAPRPATRAPTRRTPRSSPT